MQDPALWQRLQAHRFDAPGATQPFSVKLALAESWDAEFTAHVIEEYRKFLYLTQVAEAQVTPSIVVDRAWHMHLTFTRDYWEQLCPHVLGRPLHHEPCSGPEEMPRYNRQFDETRALYVAEFGMQPPPEIWGGRAKRKKPARTMAGVGLCGVSAGAVLLFMDASVAVAIGAVLVCVIVIVFDARRRARPARRDRRDGGGAPGTAGGCGGGGFFGGKGDGDGGGGGAGGCGGGCGGG